LSIKFDEAGRIAKINDAALILYRDPVLTMRFIDFGVVVRDDRCAEDAGESCV